MKRRCATHTTCRAAAAGQHWIIGPIGEVLMETGGNYQSGYLDGLMDGLMATSFERAHGRSKEAES